MSSSPLSSASPESKTVKLPATLEEVLQDQNAIAEIDGSIDIGISPDKADLRMQSDRTQ